MRYLSILFTIFVSFSLLYGMIVISTHLIKEVQAKKDAERREALYSQILESASTSPILITSDYRDQISTGSPLIFGGSHTPPIEHHEAWNKIAESGVTNIRMDLAIDKSVSRFISKSEYISKSNNLQDTKIWNRTYINNQLESMKNAKDRGMKIIGIVDYAPPWLTYSNTPYGVPNDWEMFRDIVKKTYKLYRPYVDYLEIWNEPNMTSDILFLNVTGSGLTKKEAYEQIYYNAANAIREVDEEINDGRIVPLGGPVSFTKNDASFLEPLLNNPEIAQNLNFISYHEYAKSPSDSDKEFNSLLAKYNKSDLHIFLTEWGYSSKGNEVGFITPTNQGIIYAGDMLISYLKMGLKAANYHTLTEFVSGKPNGIEKEHAFYQIKNGQVELLPLSRSWRILSKQMGLGKGESKIYQPEVADSELNSAGFVNSDGENGIALINASASASMVDVRLKNLPMNDFARVEVYIASAENDASSPVYSGLLKVVNHETRLLYPLPAESVVGIKVKSEDLFQFLGSDS